MSVEEVVKIKPTPEKLELDLSDLFHRKKRTLMLLSGSVILLGCSPAVADAIGAMKGLVGQPHPSTDTLRAALLAAATYYAWGFGHEFFAAVRTNSDQMDASELAGYERQVRFLVEKMTGQSRDADNVLAGLAAFTEKLPERIEEAFGQIVLNRFETSGYDQYFSETYSSRLNSSDPEVVKAAKVEISKKKSDILQSNRSAAIERIAEFSVSVDGLRGDQRVLNSRIDELKILSLRAAKRISLNKRIFLDRWISFWVWEGFASLTIYVVAVLFTFTTWGFALGGLIDGLIPSPS